MGTGLPRWARSAGLSPLRRRKAPAPPSLSKLIREDQAEALRIRLCKGSLELLEGPPDPDFFAKQWPRLLRLACQHMSHECLGVLVSLREQEATNPPPLPPRALGWLLEGKERHLDRSPPPDLSKPGFQAFLSHVSKGPITLRKEDGLRAMRMNGWDWVLGESVLTPKNKPGQRETLHPALETAWSAWCVKKPHIDAVVDLIRESLENPQVALDTKWGFGGFFRRVPSHKEESLRHGIGDALLQSSPARTVTARNLRVMTSWADRFSKQGWDLDHPVWEQWGTRVMATLSQPARAREGIREVANAWINVVLSMDADMLKALPGWGWDDEMQQAIVHFSGQGIPSLLESKDFSSWNLNDYCLDWLNTMDRLEKKLVVLGWREDDYISWIRAIDRALGEDWGSLVEENLDELAADGRPSAARLREKWLSWRERRMEVSIAQVPATLKPKVRL